jgi:hypothetical protein
MRARTGRRDAMEARRRADAKCRVPALGAAGVIDAVVRAR